MLTTDEVTETTRNLLKVRQTEDKRLRRIHGYLRDEQKLDWLPEGAPREVGTLARASRVNMLDLVVKTSTQAMYVDGIRAADESGNQPAWDIWQRNRMDARQIGLHRAGLAYGAAYGVVLPGSPVPVIRGASPRAMTVVYGNDDDWPRFALEKRRQGWRLLDETHVYDLDVDGDAVDPGSAKIDLLALYEHGATYFGEPVCPVVRYRDTSDLDVEVSGVVEPLIPLQDQINITTFGLLVAQHYGAFRQRYIIGWLADSEEQKLKTAASKMWTFEDSPDDIQIGEFGQTDLKGYIESREATLRHLATISQTPVHELLGQLVNLSAEALAAAEASHRRSVTEVQTVMGESHEQVLGLAGEMAGHEVDPMAWVRWKDTEARSMAQMADALGKLVQSLGVPPQELWELIPGVSQQQVAAWKAAAAEGDAFAGLTRMLEQQAADGADI